MKPESNKQGLLNNMKEIQLELREIRWFIIASLVLILTSLIN